MVPLPPEVTGQEEKEEKEEEEEEEKEEEAEVVAEEEEDYWAPFPGTTVCCTSRTWEENVF